ncbi:hypothetical protein CsSME_00034070 [Camellia sinensis var. sinensis]
MTQFGLWQCAHCESKKGVHGWYMEGLNNLHSCGVVVRTGKNNRLNS